MADASPIRVNTSAPEEWRPVHGYEGFYSVSNWGRVMRHYRTKPDRIVGGYRAKGYRTVTLGKEGSLTTGRIATLVARAFLGPRPPGAQVCHRDGHRDNDVVENLVYGSAKENAEHRTMHGTQPVGERNPIAVLTDEAVREIRRDYRYGSSEAGSTALALRYGVCHAVILNVIHRRMWSHVT